MITQVVRHGDILEKRSEKTITYSAFSESKDKGNFDLLEATFNREDVNELYNDKATVKTLISRWTKNGLIEKVEGMEGIYIKL